MGADEIKWPKVSVIIPNYNGRKNLGNLLDKCLSNALESNYSNLEVIFVDNHSTDDSVSYVEKKYADFKQLKIIQLSRNYGYAGAINIGLKNADKSSKYILILTTDVEIPKNLIRNFVLLFEQYKHVRIGTIHPLIYDTSCNMFIGELYVQYPGCDPLHPWFTKYSGNKLVEVSFPAGEVFMIKKKVIDEVNGFDKRYFMYYEDVDLGLRLRLKGYKNFLCPWQIAIHHRSATAKGELRPLFYSYIYERNKLYTCLKILSKKSLLALLFHETFRLLGMTLLSIFIKHYKYRLRSYLHIIHKIKKKYLIIKKEREIIQKNRFINDRQLFNLMYKALLNKMKIPLLERFLLPSSILLYKLFS